MDRQALDTLLKSKFGEDFDTSLITDEEILGIIGNQNNDDDNDDDDVDDNDNKMIDNINDSVDDEDDIDLDTININELSEDAKLLYKMIVKEKRARASDRIDNIISASGLSEAQKKVVKKFAKNSEDINDIKEMIAELEKDNKASKRVIGNTRVIGKHNVKSTVKNNEQAKEPAFGTREFGAMLAKEK